MRITQRRLASHWWSVLSRRGQRQRVRVQASAEPDEGACHQGDPDDGIAVDLMLHDLRAAMVTLSGLARRKARKSRKYHDLHVGKEHLRLCPRCCRGLLRR